MTNEHTHDNDDHDHDAKHSHQEDCDCGNPYDSKYFGSYGGDCPPKYEPHCLDHSCFHVPSDDYVPSRTCSQSTEEEDDQKLRPRRDQASLSQDEINRFLGSFQSLVSAGYMGPFVD